MLNVLPRDFLLLIIANLITLMLHKYVMKLNVNVGVQFSHSVCFLALGYIYVQTPKLIYYLNYLPDIDS